MKKNWKVLLFLGIILIFLTMAAIISYLSDRIPANDISVAGNTAGNLNNGGLFAESNGKVYFSNAYDNGTLYSMNVDETDLIKLNTTRTSHINIGGDYLYYYMDSSGGGTGMGYVVRTFGIYRCKLNGHKAKCLERGTAVTMQLCGDYIYYQRYNNKDFTQLYKLKTDKSENIKVSDSVINPVAYYNGLIYFNGTEKNHYLYALDTRTDTIFTVYQGNLWYPVFHNNYIYYMDVSSDYRLCRYSLNNDAVEILTQDRVETFNVGEQFIYYQKNSSVEPALMRMQLDGSNPEMVAEGNFENINLTSAYAYFTGLSSQTPIYHTPVNGPINVTTFTVAANAALRSD